MPAHYSETPLAKQLNLRDGQRVWFDAMPDSVQEEIAEYALELIFVREPEEGVDAAHIFVTGRDDLSAQLTRLGECIVSDGQIWVSWSQSAAPTQITADTVCELGEPLGLVATKEITINDEWAALKLVVRKDLR